MKKIKVAMLAPYSIDSKHNGVAMHTKKLTKYLSRRDDVELHLITICSEDKQVEVDNLKVYGIKKSFPSPFSIPSLVWSVRHKIIEINPDIVHSLASFVPYSTASALVRNRYPTLLTAHGSEYIQSRFNVRIGITFIFKMLITLPNEKYVLSKVPNIVVCSPQMKELVRNMTNSKIHVIPNGIDFEDIPNIQSHKSIEHPSILYVGGLTKIKGVDILLNAVPLIIKKIPNLHIYITGSGPEEDNLKKVVKRLNMEENVKFLGFIPEDEKYSYYKSVDVCVFPSLYEPFGIVLLEAMGSGKPVVASNVGGIPFVVIDGKTGLLFEPGNIDELAEKVIFLLQNGELRKKMGERGQERAKEFTWDKIAERMVEVYKEILSKQR